MLLRSSYNPALNSWFQQQNPIVLSSPEPDFIHRSFKSTTVSLHSSSPSNDSPKKMARASSDSDLHSFSPSKLRNSMSSLLSFVAMEEDVEEEEIESMGLQFLSSGLDGTGGGGKICGGGGGNGDYYDGSDVYYQNMIETNSGNTLILANYAKYLKEVRGDVLRAEEYCSRAIMANPNDGTALSMYADLIWETHKDASRAQSYFDQAIKVSPDNCYVMASYARFLWDADEENEEEEAPCFLSQYFPVAPMAPTSWG
ncbi:hypothetical protein L1987_54104 [Smallanthus sonchifolius]|uniref:Uncharacterized protein n=1 Tax=Smallanthus sonchifolius TaxID=185202 RepID=A0ACB9E679_9ASTR|nr:hypothetical protein L1987_54104 [Smallanthus sonchifolius]